ncbi:MAG: hypothetical protein Q8O34_12010 [Rhodocyclaceae bacterium]|nr:hypothetical protein [Rhodocyclaceae bacterium]
MKIAELLQSLSDARVQYVLVGGLAVQLHGFMRTMFDIVLVRPDVSFDKLMIHAVKGDLFGRRVPIASIDDLLAMKRIANRPRDQLDIVALEKIKRGVDPNV